MSKLFKLNERIEDAKWAIEMLTGISDAELGEGGKQELELLFS
jgi:hypothetical protein